MEVMEEGNLMDRVPILLQRDMQYYQKHQTVLQETICSGIVGGKLDFPRYASFAAVKIVHWWEDEYYASYKKNSGLLNLDEITDEELLLNTTAGATGGAGGGGGGGFTDTIDDTQQQESKKMNTKVIVKSSDPEKFVASVTKSADKLLAHIHTLSQEALDHADLTVLTATIGAAALIKNCLWVYLHSVTKTICPPKGDEAGGSLKMSYKQYSEMTEALAERLLDLHCRLLTLYIIQDADCLNWESQQTFFESERGSYTIQMWWLYMQGTKQDLWNSVPPNMAQRVFAGMLNETLTILTVRYTQTVPSQMRSQLLLVDVCNLLHCVSEILPSICESGESFVGLNITNQSKIIRDIHAKCQELFCCLLLRGISLGSLYKVLRKGTNSMNFFSSRNGLPSAWIIFTLPKLFPLMENNGHCWVTRCLDFCNNTAIALELKILLTSPQANWSLLLKILLMRNAHLSQLIMQHLLKEIPTSDCFTSALDQPFMNRDKYSSKCNGFLCGKECSNISEWIRGEQDPVGQANYQIVLSLTYILILTGKSADINRTLIKTLDKGNCARDWSSCLDKRQVWNQKRPPWFEAILHLVYPVLDPVVHMLISAVQTGATMYQAMALAISCLCEMWDCIPDILYTVASSLSDIITTEIRPLGDSVLIQILFTALYTKLMEMIKNEESNEQNPLVKPQKIPSQNLSLSSDDNQNTKSSICNILAEAICSIDEDNKHTEAINGLINLARDRHRTTNLFNTDELCEAIGGGDINGASASGGGGGGGISLVSTVKIDDAVNGNGKNENESDEITNNITKGNVFQFNSDNIFTYPNTAGGGVDANDTSPSSTRSAEEYDVENAEYISEMLVSDALTTSVGKQSMKLLYTYLLNNAEWLLQQLNVSDVELSEFQSLPGQNIKKETEQLLKIMFHIGHQSFDQLLTGGLKIDYNHWFQTPMSISSERAWLQISQRYEFQENVKLSVQDTVMVAFITSQCKPST